MEEEESPSLMHADLSLATPLDLNLESETDHLHINTSSQ